MIKQLTKVSRLHKNEWRAIKNLIDFCGEHDKFKIKAYWHILQDRLTNEFNDFLYYIDGNLIGYLGLFTFSSNEAEMTAVIHPKFRQQGIFKKMLGEAILELRQRYIRYCTWIVPQRSSITNEFMQTLSADFIFSQVEMKALRPPVERELPQITLRPATIEDLPTLAHMGAVSFQASYTEVMQRFTENMREKNRKAWLASIPDEENIGKIHVRYEDTQTAFIHDLCITPEHRGKKLAMAMILKTMDMLHATGHRNIILDVECHNKGALRLYEQCGFDIQQAHDFWRVEVDVMNTRWGR